MQSFKVIEIEPNEYNGASFEYVTKIDVNEYGEIVICTSPNVLNAMKFGDYVTYDREEKEKRELILKLVKTYFWKENYKISYRTLNTEVK